MTRVFVAVPLDEETRHRLAHLVRTRVAVMPGRAVPPENWHLTLRFLGEIDDVQLDRLRAALDAADLGPAFQVRWGTLGAFPRPSRAGVLWIGLEGDPDPLHSLSEGVDEALEVAGHAPEDRPFRPHLTICRMRPEEDVRSVVGDGAPLGVPMRVDRVAVFESRLGRGGAKYAVLEEYLLSN
ncbi:MAG: RNA 2',3'-cyclic phosphodiesterase [Actinomycetota bacterium]